MRIQMVLDILPQLNLTNVDGNRMVFGASADQDNWEVLGLQFTFAVMAWDCKVTAITD